MLSKKTTLLMSILLCIAISIVGCSSGTSGEETAKKSDSTIYKLTLQTTAAAGTPYQTCAEEFAAEVKEMTGGQIQIAVNPGGAIVPAHDGTDAVRDGVLDIAMPSSSMDEGRFGKKIALFGGTGTPAGPSAMEYLAWFYKGGGKEMAQELYDDYNAKVLGISTTAPAELFCHSSKPIRSKEDLIGLKFRTLGLWGEILSDMGASVVSVAGPEIYQAAEQGIMDAFEYTGPGVNWDSGFHEIMHYIGVPGIHSPLSTNLIIINKDTWNKLPEDLQVILESASASASLNDYLEFAVADMRAVENYMDYGNEFVKLDDELQLEIAERSKALMERCCAEDPQFKKIYDNQLEFFKSYRNREQLVQPDMSYIDLY